MYDKYARCVSALSGFYREAVLGIMIMFCLFFFFFKQKTAYEI